MNYYVILPNGYNTPWLPNANFSLLMQHEEVLLVPLFVIAAFLLAFMWIWRGTRAPQAPIPEVEQEYIYSVLGVGGEVVRTVRAFDVDMELCGRGDSAEGRLFFNFLGPRHDDGSASVAWVEFKEGMSVVSTPVQDDRPQERQ